VNVHSGRCQEQLCYHAGGDAFLSRCIWQAGYAFTDPGYSFYHWEAKSFDPGPESSHQLVQHLTSALLGACEPESLVRFLLPCICQYCFLHVRNCLGSVVDHVFINEHMFSVTKLKDEHMINVDENTFLIRSSCLQSLCFSVIKRPAQHAAHHYQPMLTPLLTLSTPYAIWFVCQ